PVAGGSGSTGLSRSSWTCRTSGRRSCSRGTASGSCPDVRARVAKPFVAAPPIPQPRTRGEGNEGVQGVRSRQNRGAGARDGGPFERGREHPGDRERIETRYLLPPRRDLGRADDAEGPDECGPEVRAQRHLEPRALGSSRRTREG